MEPLSILLGSLAVCPAVIVIGMVVNLVANNIATHKSRLPR